MMTARDPWVNMLRTTIACLSAALGGAGAITVLPFDSALGLPDQFARRIARNTQAILHDESSLARVIDPAGGSWYAEQLTDQLARGAWDWFQQHRTGRRPAGGPGQRPDRRPAIAQNWAGRSVDLAHRREPITGVSEFPNLGERPVVRDPAPSPPGGGLPRVRRAEVFEALRARGPTGVLTAIGARPKMLLATLGPRAVHTARSSFAANLFQAGGIETPLSEAAGGGKASGGSKTEPAGRAGPGRRPSAASGAQAGLHLFQRRLLRRVRRSRGGRPENGRGSPRRAGGPAGRPAARPTSAQGSTTSSTLGCDAVAALDTALDTAMAAVVDEGGES